MDLIDWLSQLNANDEADLSDLSKALLICWQIWNDRNNLTFCNCKVHPARVPMVATTVGSEYYNTNKSSRSIRNFDVVHRCSQIIKWKAPRALWLKINFNSSVVGSQAAAGFVIRDHSGSTIVSGTRNLEENTISIAEALALRDALKFAKVKGFKDICVEGDSKLVIDSILNKCRMPW